MTNDTRLLGYNLILYIHSERQEKATAQTTLWRYPTRHSLERVALRLSREEMMNLSETPD